MNQSDFHEELNRDSLKMNVGAEKPRKRVSVVEKGKEIILENLTNENETGVVDKGPKFGCRHVQTILLTLGLISGISTRTNLSVAVVAMTNSTTSPNPNVPTYENWEKSTGRMLSSFFWSYVTLQILAGYLGKNYGPKYFLFITFFINNCACACIPWAAAHIGSYGVVLCRVIQGFTQGFLYPSIHVMLGTWAPEDERATINNYIFSGLGIGTIFGNLVTGFLSASWLGWPYSFYILSLCGFAWCGLWLFLGQNSPAEHPRITPEEKKYIQSSLKQEEDISLPTPWKEIFTCVPFYALLVAYVGNIWGYTILMTETPTYLAGILQFDVTSVAEINSIPSIFGLITALITGPLADWLIRKNFLSTLNCRRVCHGIGSYGQALCLVWLSFITQSQGSLSVVILTLATTLSSFTMVGCNVNHLDLSPRFSGIIFGVLNATGQVASIVAPLFVQLIVTEKSKLYQWRIVFLTSATIFAVGATVFIIFASATRQKWDGPETKATNERRKKISMMSMTSMT